MSRASQGSALEDSDGRLHLRDGEVSVGFYGEVLPASLFFNRDNIPLFFSDWSVLLSFIQYLMGGLLFFGHLLLLLLVLDLLNLEVLPELFEVSLLHVALAGDCVKILLQGFVFES